MDRAPSAAAQPGLSATIANQSTGWSNVGAANFSIANVTRLKTVVSPNGDTFTANVNFYPYQTGYSSKIQLMKYDGRSWRAVGGVIDGVSLYDLAVDRSGVPHIAYQTNIYPPEASAIKVVKLAGGAWERVGTTPMKGGTRTGAEVHLAIDTATNAVYLAYGNGDYEEYPQHNKVTVRKFDGRSNWNPVGPEGLSTGGAWGISLKANAGKVFLAFCDQDDGGRIAVKQFNGTAWAPVGSNAAGLASAAIQAGTGAMMALDASDSPLIAYPTNQNKIVIRKLVGSRWATVNDPTASTPQDLRGFGVDRAGNPIVTTTYNNYPYGYFTKVYKFSGQSWKMLGGELPGQSRLTVANGVPYVTLVYFRKIPEFEGGDVTKPRSNIDDTKYATVKKFTSGTSDTVRPTAAKR